MRNRMFIAAIILLGMASIFSLKSEAQILLGQPTSGGVQPVFSYWELKNSDVKIKLAQLATPLSGFVPLGENLEATFYFAGASNELTTPTSEYSLSGVGDARIQFSRSFSNDQLLFSGGFNIPTGKKKLDLSKEWLVIEYLSQNYLQFPFTKYGEGFGFNALVGGATMLGEIRCGGGAMFEFTGEYEPYEGLDKYNPGDIFSLNGGIELGESNRLLMANVIYTIFTTDQVAGKKIFKQSPLLELQTAASAGNEFGTAAVDIRYLARGRNTRYSEDESTLEQLKFFGNELAAGLTLGKYFSRKWIFSLAGEMRLLGSNELNFGKSEIFGVGGGIASRPEERFGIGVDYRYFTGNVDDNRIELTGHQVLVSLSASL